MDKLKTDLNELENVKNKILVLGDGLLGSEIVKQSGCNYLSRKKDNFDISDVESYYKHFLDIYNGVIVVKKYDTIVNCIANTDTYSNDRDNHWNINYKFVSDLVEFCNKFDIKIVHISTDYIYTGSVDNATEEDVPVHCNNWYGYTKLLGDGLVQLLSKNYLLFRCTHKPNPFPYDNAWIDQVGNFDYVDYVADKIIKSIQLNGVYNIGSELKSVFELALKTKENVSPVLSPGRIPKNTSMSTLKLDRELNKRPFFSVAIPTYSYNGNGIDFLRNNFEILSNQTFKDFEVVISDHSLDSSIKSFCENWKDKLNIFYIRNEKGRGIISPNINVALSNCKGEWIKILFQDDFLFNETSLEKQYNFIINNLEINWFATKFVHSNDGKTFYREFTPRWVDDIWSGNNLIGSPSVITIRNNNVILFDEDLNWLMDCDYYCNLNVKYGEPALLNEFTVVSRTNSERLTNNITQNQKDIEFKKLKERWYD